MVGGDADGERRRVKSCLLREARKLTLVPSITAAFGAEKCTDIFGFDIKSLSAGAVFCALPGGISVQPRVCTARWFVAFMVDVFNVGRFNTTALSVYKVRRLPTAIGSHVTQCQLYFGGSAVLLQAALRSTLV